MIYEFVKHCMDDESFNNGGIPTNEKAWADAVGFKYKEDDGTITESGRDLKKFYKAMQMLQELERKYSK